MMKKITKTYYKNKKNSLILNFFVYIMVLLASCDIFTYYFSTYLKGISFYGVLLIIVFIITVNCKDLKVNILHTKQIIFFLAWITYYIIINQFIINYQYPHIIMGINFNEVTVQAIQVICVFITYFYLDSEEYDKVKVNIIKIIFFSIIIDAIITLRAVQIDPNIAKIMATGKPELNIYELKGVSGYSIVYSVIIILPLLYYSLKKLNKKYKIITILLIALIIYFVYKAAYTIAFIALILGILIYLFLNTSNKMKIFLIPTIILFAIFLINITLIFNILIYLSNKIEITQISTRFQQLANFILNGDNSGDTLYRFTLYRQSIDAFLKYPFTGISIFEPNYSLSGHSAFLDILGSMGLIGFIPYFLFILYSYKISIKKTKDKRFKNAVRTSYLIFCFIGCINTLITSFTINLFLLFFINWYPIFINNVGNKKMM